MHAFVGHELGSVYLFNFRSNDVFIGNASLLKRPYSRRTLPRKLNIVDLSDGA